MNPHPPTTLLARLSESVALFERDPARALDALRPLYAEDLRYESPIQTLRGREGFLRLMGHMATRFTPFSMRIEDGLESEERIFGRFRLSFKAPFLQQHLDIEGVTRCVISGGRIVEQRDYYDALSRALDAVPLAGPVYRKIIAQFALP
ncbi:MAG: nuclear transport factor 2 family protein [Polyangiaceae bacterium]